MIGLKMFLVKSSLSRFKPHTTISLFGASLPYWHFKCFEFQIICLCSFYHKSIWCQALFKCKRLHRKKPM